jgi:hypothetical protein
MLLQFLLTAAAGAGLWRLWRAIAATDARVAAIVGIGFLLRALGGQALFWISWLGLPVARSLQSGDGLWFYAVDGRGYLDYAGQILAGGPAAFLAVDARYPSHSFVQLLTICVGAFGSVASVAILLNAFAYLATCLVVIRLADPKGPARLACLAALAAVALGPSAILWSLQPLKDTVFVMLVVAMIGACRVWEAACRDEQPARWRFAAAAAAMLALMYAIAGMRWYLGAILWVVGGAFLGLTALTARRRVPTAIAAAVVFVLLSQSLRFGGADDVAPWVQRQLDPRTALSSLGSMPIASHIAETRRGFETTPGATMITAAARPAPQPPPAAAAPPATPSVPAAAPALTGKPSPAAPQQAAGSPDQQAPAAVSKPVTTPPPVESRWHRIAGQLATGFAALLLPVSLGRMLGVISVGGGRNLWAFVDLDTIALDLVLLFALWYCGRHFLYRRRPTALFVMVAAILGATVVPMVYSVTNFGTLFRLREMVYVLAAVLPVTLASAVTPPRPQSSGKDG